MTKCMFFNTSQQNVHWIPHVGIWQWITRTRKATLSRILTWFLFLDTTMTRILRYNYSFLSWQRWKLVLGWTYHLSCGLVADLGFPRGSESKTGIPTYYLAYFPDSCIKMKKNGPRGKGPKICLCRSTATKKATTIKTLHQKQNSLY